MLVWYRPFTYHPDLGIRYFTFSYQPGTSTGFKTDFQLVCGKIIPICPIPYGYMGHIPGIQTVTKLEQD